MTTHAVPDSRKIEFVRLIQAGVLPQTAGRQVGASPTTAQRWRCFTTSADWTSLLQAQVWTASRLR